MNRIQLSATAVLALTLAMAAVPMHISVRATDFVLHPHSAISILSNEGFTPEKGVVGGTGTAEDPYIIEGWDIDGQTTWVLVIETDRAAMLIANTTAHVTIRHVYAHDGGSRNLGITVVNASNVSVESVKVWNGNTGVTLIATTNSIVASSEVYDLISQGIGLWGGPFPHLETISNTIIGNTVHDTDVGINLVDASSNTISQNVLFDVIRGSFIIRGSTDNQFIGNHFSDMLIGVSVSGRSNGNVIEGNVFERMEIRAVGIGSIFSTEIDSRMNLVEGNTVVDSNEGIKISQTSDTSLVHNTIQAVQVGIVVLSSERTRVTGNAITAQVGISICSKGPLALAPPPNDLTATSERIVHCKGGPM